MHFCGTCGQACYCDGEDHESQQPLDCCCPCDEADECDDEPDPPPPASGRQRSGG